MVSLNTNNAAVTALRTLQATNAELDRTQKSISTGLKIGEAKDNAAYWSISTTLKSDNRSLATVKDALGLGAATADTAYQGLNKAKEVLDEIKAKLSIASQDGVDRNKIQGEIDQLQKQLKSIATSSTFSGENWLQSDTASANYKASKDIVSSVSRSASGAISIGTIAVDVSTVALFDSNANGAGAIVDSKVALTTSSGALTVGGFAPGATPNTDAVNFGTTLAAGMTAGSSGGAKITLGAVNMSNLLTGDKITFTLKVNGVSNGVTLDTTPLVGETDPNVFKTALQTAVDASAGAGKVTVGLDTATNAITLTTTASGSGATIAASDLDTVDGDGLAVTKTGGLLTTASLPAPVSGTGTVAAAKLGTFTVPTASTSPVAAAASMSVATNYTAATTNPALTFDMTYKGVTKTITVAAAGGASTGTGTAGTLKSDLQAALNAQYASTTFSDGTTYAAGDLVADVSAGNPITVTTLKKGTRETLSYVAPTSSGGATAGTVAATNGLGTPAGIAIGDVISFDVTYGVKTKTITHTFTAAEINGFATKGQPTAKEFAALLQTNINTEFAGTQFNDQTGTDNTYSLNDIVLKAGNSSLPATAADLLSIETKKTGAAMAVGITNVKATIYGVDSTTPLGLTNKSVGYSWDDGTSAFVLATDPNAKLGYGSAKAPEITLGTFDQTGLKNGDTISMVVNYTAPVAGAATDSVKTITVKTTGFLDSTVAGNAAANQAKLQSLVQAELAKAFGGKVTFAIDNAGKMTMTGAVSGDKYRLAMASVEATKGDGVDTGTGGITIAAGGLSAAGSGASTTNTSAVLTGLTVFDTTQPVALGSGSIKFGLAVDGAATPVTVTIDKDVVNTALTTGGRTVTDGTIRSAADYATVLNAALTTAGLNTQVTAGVDGVTGMIALTRTVAGSAGTLQMSNLVASAGATTMSVDKIDISDRTFTTLGVNGSNMKDVLTAYIDVVNSAINKVTTAAASLGSVASRINMQMSFVDTLMDTINKGIGSLVDADMSEESTRLQALQTKQQLGVQALSIANQSAQSILALFRN